MGSTNENILKSLAVLEQNLIEINSAKEQVNNVVKSSSDLAKVVDSYNSSFESIAKNTESLLKEIKSINLETISKLSEQTKSFNNEVVKLTEFDFTNSFNTIEVKVIDKFNNDLQSSLKILEGKSTGLNVKIEELKSQILRLEKFDLKSNFNEILSTLTNYTANQNLEISKKHEALKVQNENIILQLNKQDDKIKTVFTFLYIIIGIIVIGTILNVIF
jgi:hypothetical protein